MRFNAAVVGLNALLVVSGCASAPSTPRALLDERTGITLSAVSKPMVFVRAQDSLDASIRQYVTLVALEKDNGGQYTQLLLMYRWNASFKGRAAPAPDHAGRLIIQIDGQDIELQPLDQIPVDLSQKALMAPEDANVPKYAYLTDFAMLRRIASSHELAVRLPQEPDSSPFPLWRDGRPALEQLIQQLNGS
jgi:hypothetical protein